MVPSGYYVGIVVFETDAKTVAPLTKLNSETDRKELANKLPTHPSGWTAIGKGLLKGVEVILA